MFTTKCTFRIFSLIVEMLGDRDYIVPRPELELSATDFVARFGNNPRYGGGDDKTAVHYSITTMMLYIVSL